MGENALKDKVVLVTGAAGFTGRHAVEHLTQLGAKVAAVLRASSGVTLQAANAVYHCDLEDRGAVHQLVHNIQPDYVLHLAGQNSVPASWADPLTTMQVNVMSPLYLLDAARAIPHCRIVIVGSRLKYTPPAGGPYAPPHPYSLSKYIEEIMALAWTSLYGQPIVYAEPGNLIGPGPSTGICTLLARHAAAAESGSEPAPFRLSSPEDRRDFLDVRDAVRAYALLLQSGKPGVVYPVISGTERKLGEVTELIVSHAASQVPLEWGAPSSGPGGSSASDDHNASLRELGWQPLIPFAQSILDILNDARAAKRGGLA
ncbi:NAD-dependent epimerase/dehydratase family protein [Neobacillus mesonae]|nr:NAD-dependent epimerase/dehydratase family protein [Neobacillus mesonae]